MPLDAPTRSPHVLVALALAAILGLCWPAAAQQPGADKNPQNLPLHASSELETFYFRPTNVSVRELADIAQRMFGRSIYIKDKGGYESRPVENLQRLGDTLIILPRGRR